MPSRIEREREFHNREYTEGIRAEGTDKFYSIQRFDRRLYSDLLTQSLDGGAQVLEYGCGPGSEAACFLAERGATVTGIDISQVAIAQASERAQREGVGDRCTFRVMDAENLEFESESFDLTFGSGILHHLDLDTAYSEVARTLKPGGRAVFYEPLGHNPAINLYRRRTPEFRTVDEHPLLMRDVRLAESYFRSVDYKCFHLLTLLAIPFRRARFFDGLLRGLSAADDRLLKLPLQRYAWTVLISLKDPLRR
jgi:SAM-dependent methyltransferase